MTKTMTDKILIEVAYALPKQQKIVELEVDAGTLAIDAAKAANIDNFFDGLTLDIDSLKMGIFGKAIKPKTHIMSAGERIEIYRPLKADPKASRKARADKSKANK